MAAVYAADAVLLPPNAPPVHGNQRIAEFFAGSPLTITEFIVARENIEVHGRMAINRGSYTLKFTLPAGAGSDDGKFLWVLKKDGDRRWKIAVDMFSSNRPPS